MIHDRFLQRQDGADALEEGYWLIARHRACRVDIPVRIWFGPPNDPDTGELMDRSPRWRILIGNAELDCDPIRLGGILLDSLSSFWPACASRPIDEAEYQYRIDRQEWAADYDRFDPFATPGGRVDPMTATLPFMD